MGSKHSLSKYVRIGGELGLYEFNYRSENPTQGVLSPNSFTPVMIGICMGPSQIADRHAFELTSESKVLFLSRLLESDYSYLLPLVYAFWTQGEIEVKQARKIIGIPYLQLLVEFHEWLVRAGGISHADMESSLRRLTFLRQHLRQSESKNVVSRGFLHWLDPRLHWLYDLIIVDPVGLCKRGVVAPAAFWAIRNEETVIDFSLRILRNVEGLVRSYYRAINKGPLRPPSQVFTAKNRGEALEEAITILRPYFTGFLSLNSIIELTFLICLSCGISTSKNRILEEMVDREYRIYRDITASDGYVDVP